MKLPRARISKTSVSRTSASGWRERVISGSRCWSRKEEPTSQNSSLPEQLADGFEILDVIAIRLHDDQHRHRQQRSPDAPDEAPEDQPHKDRDFVRLGHAARQPWRQQPTLDARDDQGDA